MSGHWLYDEAVDQPVDIVGLPYEFWFELAKHEGTLEAGESPALPRADGLLYYVRFAHAGDPLERTWVNSGPCVTVAAAVAAAEQRVPTPITWDT